MSHLTAESIARLVDDSPTPEEARHLEGCAPCRAELEDMRADAAALRALPPLEPSTESWPVIEARLRREGLIRSPLGARSWRSALLRIAAGVVIFLLGGVAGTLWVGSRDASGVARAGTEPLPQIETDPARTGDAVRPEEGRPVLLPEPREELIERGAADPRFASALISAREPRTPEEAAVLARDLEALYYQMLARVAETAPPTEAGDPYTRLAVLEGITTLTGTALGQAPADPILNGYHVAALAQREATLRQIAARTAANWF